MIVPAVRGEQERERSAVRQTSGWSRSWTIKAIPWALAQAWASRAPVWVLQVFKATPVQPSSRPRRISRQSWALSSRKRSLRSETLRTSIGKASRS